MKRLISGLHKLEEYSLILCLAVMGIVLFVQIIMRTFFRLLSNGLRSWQGISRYGLHSLVLDTGSAEVPISG